MSGIPKRWRVQDVCLRVISGDAEPRGQDAERQRERQFGVSLNGGMEGGMINGMRDFTDKAGKDTERREHRVNPHF